MSLDVKAQPNAASEAEYWYSAESLRFARHAVSVFEDQLKEHARELAFADGRDTISEEDMRDAVTGLLRNLSGIVDDPGSNDV